MGVGLYFVPNLLVLLGSVVESYISVRGLVNISLQLSVFILEFDVSLQQGTRI